MICVEVGFRLDAMVVRGGRCHEELDVEKIGTILAVQMERSVFEWLCERETCDVGWAQRVWILEE